MFQMPVRLLDEDAPGGATYKIEPLQDSRPESSWRIQIKGGYKNVFFFFSLYFLSASINNRLKGKNSNSFVLTFLKDRWIKRCKKGIPGPSFL